MGATTRRGGASAAPEITAAVGADGFGTVAGTVATAVATGRTSAAWVFGAGGCGGAMALYPVYCTAG